MNKGSIRYLRPKEIEGLEIQEVVNSNHSFPNHTHGFHSVGVMEADGCYCRQPGSGSSFVRSGEIALFNPGLVHSGVLTDLNTRLTYRVFSFDNPLIKKALVDLAEKDSLPEFKSIVIKDKLTTGTLTQLNLAVKARTSRLALDTALARAAAALLARHCETVPRVPQTKEPTAVKLAREYLTENLSGQISLDELSKIAGLSRYHLLRVFKRATGLPPHSYHLQQRIEHAKRLLRSGTPFAETALQSGFSDQSHFTNTFRKYTGATPTQYTCI
ncbi:helix-turn-helix domain-containing protein [Maridesulfovibrio hydrothermalis]|uniref:Transcriptional regulator, AraC family n=1 Tax=Maridesulfovibrio hydrothermalis AM13 = DSM 14728 TaxID=1121451 RepID=L0RBE8_9BACT|nr:AraC family transcriptional regulator [Maridesulfovibrio hydrothermalis]CCO23495.1 Transcriptional regulator, AraC family [Maridesulfovibrio hydrothermalis AM13 = DSM 14728]